MQIVQCRGDTCRIDDVTAIGAYVATDLEILPGQQHGDAVVAD